MRTTKPRYCQIIGTLILVLCTPLHARDVDNLDWTGLKEEWGQLLFCQRIYTMPEVKPRLYNFDIEQCDKAGQLMSGMVSEYSEQERIELKNQAERHAGLLARNTSEPYHAVTACRAYCSELAEIQDQRND